MKKYILLLSVCFFAAWPTGRAQHSPQWTRSINALPDTALVSPMNIKGDGFGNVFVLSRYTTVSGNQRKIYLHKYQSDGTLTWSMVYDSTGRGQPMPMDMILDADGNCYISGYFYTATSSQPILLMKIDSSGSFRWIRDSCTAFHNGDLGQLVFHNGILQGAGYAGALAVDTAGNELWSVSYSVQGMAVDRSGNTILSIAVAATTNIVKLDPAGNTIYMDSATQASRIAVDDSNNYYFLTGYFPTYELAKFDSACNPLWSTSNFPQPPPFGDIFYEVLVDFDGNVLAVGLSDTMFKFNPAGQLIWRKPMDGLDSYLGSVDIVSNNFLAVAGSTPDSNGYNMEVRLYDRLGNVSWHGHYNGTVLGQEYTTDAAYQGDGIYAVETTEDSATLVKFDTPFFQPIDYSLVCVDSVWYNPLDPTFINVRVFNGNISHMNYPSVRIVSMLGDTVGNPSNFVNFFAHLGNMYQVYTDTITQAGITDFSGYTFVMMEFFGDSSGVIGWCGPVGLPEIERNSLILFPNPAQDKLVLQWSARPRAYTLEIFNSIGALVFRQKSGETQLDVDVSGLSEGIYIARINGEKGLVQKKFIVARQ